MKREKRGLGTAPIGKLMLAMGIPMILSMMLQALYNIVDSAFVTNLPEYGNEAFAALTLAFPVQMLIVAIGIGTGVGVNALVSRSLGQGDQERANRAAGNGLFLAAVIYAVFLIFGLACVKPFVQTQTQDELIAAMTEEYLTICCTLSFGTVFFAIFEKLLQSTGKSTFSTIAQIGGAAANIILDPVMMYDWGLGLGIAGAAWATVIGQMISLILSFSFHLFLNKEISKHVRYLKPSARIIGRIYAIGLPAIIAQALMSVMTLGMNMILNNLDPAGNYTNAYGLYYKIQLFVLFAAFGLRDAITPVVSFNYGHGSKQRVRDGVKFGLIYTAVIMAAGTVILEACAEPLTAVFGGLAPLAQSLSVNAARIISSSFLFAGTSIALQGVFQAIDGGLQSLIISILRQCLLVLPVAYAFTLLASADGSGDWLVWLTFPIAEVLTTAFAVGAFIAAYKKKIAPMQEHAAETETTEPPQSAE